MSKPLKHATVVQITNSIFKKSIMKLPTQYAFSFMPEISCKCLRPPILSTTRYETTNVMQTEYAIAESKMIRPALSVATR